LYFKFGDSMENLPEVCITCNSFDRCWPLKAFDLGGPNCLVYRQTYRNLKSIINITKETLNSYREQIEKGTILLKEIEELNNQLEIFDKCGPLFQKRSEEHTSELQSHHDLVCRLLLEKKKKK